MRLLSTRHASASIVGAQRASMSIVSVSRALRADSGRVHDYHDSSSVCPAHAWSRSTAYKNSLVRRSCQCQTRLKGRHLLNEKAERQGGTALLWRPAS